MINKKLKKKLRIGLLGLGTIVKDRFINLFLNELKNTEIAAVFDLNKKKNYYYSKIFNCEYVKNENDFFRKDLDFIYISTPPHFHYENIIKSFSYLKNVIVEKPPVLRVDELKRLIKISKKKTFILYSFSK